MRSSNRARAQVAAPLHSGLVADRYQLLSEVARGGCGAVFEARDLAHDTIVAIKILQPGGFDRAAAARFMREARVAAAIRHPNVCAVSDSGTLDDGSPFLVMERLHGETLRAYVGRVVRLDAEEAIEFAVQMLSGLEASHAIGIVHRDVKPENIFLVRPKGCMPLVKLLDFGMCRGAAVHARNDVFEEELRLDRTLTRAGTVVGTPEYMAPEQASGRRQFDLRIDLYAVGVVLYETLTGTRAFYGTDPRAVLLAVLGRQLPNVRAIRPDLPVAVDRIVARALERDPRARYHSAAEFQHDLLQARTTLRRQRAAKASAAQRMRGVELDEWEAPTTELPSLRRMA
ncbi:MAG: serine/threonine protein kinase [Labilithrix sp.]|nr:serine/threonine protein kinase [Labilithrix sp.]